MGFYQERWIKIKVNEYLYFVYYDFGGHSFHNPINEKELKKYASLEIVDIDELITEGEDINELLSLQFCDKIHDFICR